MKAATKLGALLLLVAGVCAAAAPAAAVETVATFASDCSTAKTVFQLGDTVCAKVAGVAGGDLGNIWVRWVAPSGTVVAGSPTGGGNTVVTTDPQTFTFALPTSGVGAERGLWKVETANVSGLASRVAANFRVPRQTVIGVHRDATSTSFTRNTNTTGFGDGSVVFGQQAGDKRLWGDWFGTGRYTPGFYRPSDGTFHIATSNVSPTDDITFPFGPIDAQVQPLAGDWTGDGKTKIGIFLNGAVSLRNTLTAGPADTTFLFGQPGDLAFAGDFDGDGIATVGVYRDNGFGVGLVFLRNSNTDGIAEVFFFYGLLGDTPIAGNWTAAANGMSTIGVHRPSEGTFYLRNSNDTGFGDIVATFGTVTDLPAVTDHNEAPVVTAGGTLGYTENQAATAIDPAITITDMDNGTLIGATVNITGNCNAGQDVLSFANTAQITASGGGCSLTLTGTDTVANYQTALRNVKYNNSSDNPNTSARTVTWQVNDGSVMNNLSLAATSTINVGATNDAPVLTAGATIGYTEGDAAKAIDNTITVTDPDNPNLASATVQITANFQSTKDELACPDCVANGLTANFDTGTDTVANYQTALRNVKYNNSSDNPNTSARTVTWQVNDGSAMNNLSGAVTSTVNVGAVNDAPVLTAGATIGYTEGDAAKVIDNTITVTDPDNPNLASATVQITANFQSTKDELACPDCVANGLTANFDTGTGTLTISNSATLAVYQAVLRTVTYRNTGNNPGATGATRTITWIGSDGTASSAPVTSTINITDVNTAPIVTAGGTLNYTENQAATAIDATVTVTDDGTIASATVQITSNCTSPQDVLGFTNAFSVTNGGYVSGTCTLTLNGPTTPANFQSALRAVTYQNTSDNPNTAARTVTWTVTDTGALSNTAVTSTINVTAVNDPPILTAGGTLSYTENQPATAIDATITVNDPDSANLQSATVQITGNCTSPQDVLQFTNAFGVTSGGFVNATCTLTLNGPASPANFQSALRTVTYVNGSDNPSTAARTVTWIASDGLASSVGVTSTINVTAVNDPPVITAGATLSYTEDQAATVIDNTITITDVDSTTIQSATVQITSTCTPAEDVLSFVNQSGVTNSGYVAATCTLTLTGPTTLANFQTALRNVKYNNTSQNPITAQRIVTWIVNDGAAANNLSAGATSTINVTAVNDAPVAQDKSGAGIQDGASVQANMKRTGINANLLTGATDPDNGVNGCTVTFSVASIVNGTNGTVSNVNLAAGTFDFEPTPGFTGAATVKYTISDNASDAGDGCPGPTATSAQATINLTVNGPVIWFVNPAVAGPGTGSLSDPFKFLSGNAGASNDADDVDAANQNIFLFSGTHTTGITLNSGESLIGQGVSTASDATFTSFDAVFGITPPVGTIARPSIAGARPTVQGTVTLNTDSKVRGLSLSTGATTGLADPAGAITGVVVSEVDVTTTTGTGVNLSNVAGTFTFTALTTSGGTGANLTGSNGSATFNFAAVTISSAGNPGFASTGGGTLNITGSNNTITSTTGTALNVSNTTIGASGVTFKTVSANGAANGIVLNTTGTGAFTVAGDGGVSNNGSGGVIQNTTAEGILLSNVGSVSLNYINITNPGTDGIRATTLNNGLTVNRVNIDDSAGTAPNDKGIDVGDFTTGTAVTGTVNITNSVIGPAAGNSPHDSLAIGIGSGTSTWNITGTTFRRTGNSGIDMEARGSSNVTLVVTGSTFAGANIAGGTGSPSARGVFVNNLDDSIVNVTIQTSSFTNNNIHIDLNQQNDTDPVGSHTFKVLNNTTMTGARSHAMNIFSATGGGGVFTGTVQGNTIGNSGVASSGSEIGNGIRVNINGDADATMLLDTNTIRQTPNGRGIEIIGRNGTGGLDVTVTGNDVNPQDTSGFPLAAILVQSNCLTICNTVRSDVRNNTVPAASDVTDLLTTYIELVESSTSTLQLVDTGAASANCTAQLTSTNTGSASATSGCALIAGPISTPP